MKRQPMFFTWDVVSEIVYTYHLCGNHLSVYICARTHVCVCTCRPMYTKTITADLCLTRYCPVPSVFIFLYGLRQANIITMYNGLNIQTATNSSAYCYEYYYTSKRSSNSNNYYIIDTGIDDYSRHTFLLFLYLEWTSSLFRPQKGLYHINNAP